MTWIDEFNPVLYEYIADFCLMSSLSSLVLGASSKPQRYSNMAVQSLLRHGHSVTAVGRREGLIGDLPIVTKIPEGLNVHTITLYLNEQNQQEWEQRILDLQPKRIIFNPGAENSSLYRKAQENGVEVLNACTLVMLNTAQF